MAVITGNETVELFERTQEGSMIATIKQSSIYTPNYATSGEMVRQAF